MNCEERPCFACGKTTGGNLRNHEPGCSYVSEMSEKYAAVRDFVAGANADMSWAQKKEPKKKKHALPSKEDKERAEEEAEDHRFHAQDN